MISGGDTLIDEKGLQTSQDYIEKSSPTAGHSAILNIQRSFIEPFYVVNPEISNQFKDMNEAIDLQLSKRTPSTWNKVNDWISSMVGYNLNPLPIIGGIYGGKVIGLAAHAVAAVGERLLPSAALAFFKKPLDQVLGNNSFVPKIVERGAKRPATVGEASSMAANTYGFAAGSMLPAELVENYNRDTKHINFGGVISGTAADGGIGLLLGVTPFAIGTVWKKIFGKGHIEIAKGVEESVPKVGELKDLSINEFKDHPIAKQISQALTEKRITPKEAKLAEEYLTKPNEDMLNKRASEALIEDGIPIDSATNRVFLSLSTKADNKNIMDGIADGLASDIPDEFRHAYIQYVAHNRLDNFVADNSKMVSGIDQVVKDAREKISYKDKKLKEADDMLETIMANEFHEIQSPEHFAEIKEIHEHIKSNRKNYHADEKYERLHDLSDHFFSARAVIDRLHLEDEYEKQHAFADVLDTYNNILKSNPGITAKPESVLDYTRQKLFSMSDEVRPLEESITEPKSIKIENDEKILKYQAEDAERSGSKIMKEEYQIATDKYREFKSSTNIFKDLISCLMGMSHG